MPEPNSQLNGKIYYVPGQPAIYWMDNGLARHIPDEATYHGVFGDSPNKQAYGALLTEVTLGLPICDGTELVRAGNDAKIYLVENQTKRWITDEGAKAYFQLNGKVHSLPLATVNSFADGPAFVTPPGVVVPDVSTQNLTYKEAASIIFRAGLLAVPGVYPNGTKGPITGDCEVVSQKPDAGWLAQINTSVSLFTRITR